jgi:DNA-directed RNA polymerase subunit RPC12/RpoP
VNQIVICRGADEKPRKPNTQTGYFCRACGRELAVTRTGCEHIRAGGVPYCNPCGFAIMKKEEAADRVGGVMLSPEAAEQLIERARKARERNENN